MSKRLAELARGAFVPKADAMDEMVWLGDTQGKCVYLNKAHRAFWGVEANDVPRFSWDSTLLPEDRARVIGVMNEAMRTRRPFKVRGRYRRADGAVRVLETTAEPRIAPNGEFLGMVGINTDVTEQPE